MNFFSFFAGIGGIDLGLERAGHTCVGQCEIDPFCRKVLAKHWPAVPLFGDIRDLAGDELPDADLWTAGFPCQDISNAGKRAGIHGDRSGLFFDLARLVREVRPRYLLLENVSALLTRGMGTVLGELAESGYDAEWNVVSAADVGAPHLRRRVFILANAQRTGLEKRRALRGDLAEECEAVERSRVAVPNTEGQPVTLRPATGKRPGRLAGGGAAGANAVGKHDDNGRFGAGTICRERSEPARIQASQQWLIEPAVGRVAHGVPSRVDRLRALGNAVVPQVAEYIGRILAEAENA